MMTSNLRSPGRIPLGGLDEPVLIGLLGTVLLVIPLVIVLVLADEASGGRIVSAFVLAVDEVNV